MKRTQIFLLELLKWFQLDNSTQPPTQHDPSYLSWIGF